LHISNISVIFGLAYLPFNTWIMIDYKAEVKKVYPNADDDFYPIPEKGKSKLDWACDYCINATPFGKYTDISGLCSTPQLAWQSAYESLVKQGII